MIDNDSLVLRDALDAKHKEFHGDDRVMGITSLTNPAYISSSRSIMLTLHMKQFVNLNEPEFPKVFTNYENLTGKYSTNYKRVKSPLKIVRKIQRFEEKENHLYTIFTYDESKDKYDIITKKIVEDLTEKFGFGYDNTVMDNVQEGDIVDEEEVLYKSLSYDQHMNYAYGINARVGYFVDNATTEDACKCSESFAKRATSKEVDTVVVSINDNDILCNIYGDDKTYKPFPDVGETIEGNIVCSKRRIQNDQMLYDLKKSNLKKINTDSDVPYYAKGEIIDITVYSNKPIDELLDNNFNRQIKKYLKDQMRYYEEVYETTEDIMKSGSKYSDTIEYLNRRSREILDDECKWRFDDGGSFGHLLVEFSVVLDVPITVGSKITGTSGDKSVVSKIVPDNEMPYIVEDGVRKPLEVMLNSLGVTNRLSSWQLFQLSINFITNHVVVKMRYMTNSEKKKLLLDIVRRFNTEQFNHLKEYMNELTSKEIKEFYEDIDKNGIYIHIQPLWEKENEVLFDRINRIYKDYPWITQHTVYIDKWGRKIPLLQSMVIAEKYMIKMKQSSMKGFSARSTGTVNKQGLPSKSSKAKDNLHAWSQTPIRLGIDENINTVIGVPSSDMAMMHLLYRSSPTGRKELTKSLSTAIDQLDDVKVTHEFKNRNAEILSAYLKILGYRIVFSNQSYNVKHVDSNIKPYITSNNCTLIGNENHFNTYEKRIKERNKGAIFLGTRAEYEKSLDDIIKKEREKEIEDIRRKYRG